MRRQTKGQARADHGPAQQGIRVNLRQEPGSPGTRLKLVISKKQKIKFKKLQNTDSCKKTLEYDGEWTRVKLEERAVKRAETSPTNTKNSRELVGRYQNGQNNQKQKSKESTHMITCIHRQVPTSPKRGRVWSPLGWTAKTCQALSA